MTIRREEKEDTPRAVLQEALGGVTRPVREKCRGPQPGRQYDNRI